MLAIEDNLKHGKGYTKEYKLRQALYLIGIGYTAMDAAYIDPDEWVEWCKLNDMPIDGRGRSAFAAVVLARRARAH